VRGKLHRAASERLLVSGMVRSRPKPRMSRMGGKRTFRCVVGAAAAK
jgi:hypothetical protein